MKEKETPSESDFKIFCSIAAYLEVSPLHPDIYEYLLSQQPSLPHDTDLLHIINEAYAQSLHALRTQDISTMRARSYTADITSCLAWLILVLQAPADARTMLLTQQLQRSLRYSIHFPAVRDLAVNLRRRHHHIPPIIVSSSNTWHTMKIEIEGNPGTGNTFTEVHIGQVQNYNPAATTVVNNYYSDGTATDSLSKDKVASTIPNRSPKYPIDTRPIHVEILRYVSKVRPLLADEYKSHFHDLWTDILAIPEVDAEVYTPGKQQGTNFNRNLVANLLHQLGEHGFFGQYNAAAMARQLEGDSDHSVRSALGTSPARVIYNKVEKLLEA